MSVGFVPDSGPRFADHVGVALGGRGVEVVLELVGGTYVPESLNALADRSCDVILSNPPYVGAEEGVDAAVGFEPAQAVFAADDGGAALAAIIAAAPRCLKRGGFLALEHGYRQGERVRALLAAHGFSRITTATDLEGRERATSAWRD